MVVGALRFQGEEGMFSNYTQKQHEGEEFPACGTSSSKTGAVLVDYLK